MFEHTCDNTCSFNLNLILTSFWVYGSVCVRLSIYRVRIGKFKFTYSFITALKPPRHMLVILRMQIRPQGAWISKNFVQAEREFEDCVWFWSVQGFCHGMQGCFQRLPQAFRRQGCKVVRVLISCIERGIHVGSTRTDRQADSKVSRALILWKKYPRPMSQPPAPMQRRLRILRISD